MTIMEEIKTIVTREIIEQYWPLTNVELKEVLQDAGTRIVQLISAKEGLYVYKVLDTWYTEEQLVERLYIFDFLKEKGFSHIQQLLKTRNNERFEVIKGRFVLILKYEEGREPEKTKENFQQLGRIMGELNNITDYPYQSLVKVDAARPEIIAIADELPTHMRDGYLALAKNLPDLDSLPQSLIHFEIILGRNNIQKPDGTIIFLDWDEAGIGTTILDPGYMLVNGFISEDLVFDKENAQVFYDNYLAVHPLSKIEKEHLVDASIFHALRYIKYDPENRWRRIRWAMENRDLLDRMCEK